MGVCSNYHGYFFSVRVSQKLLNFFPNKLLQWRINISGGKSLGHIPWLILRVSYFLLLSFFVLLLLLWFFPRNLIYHWKLLYIVFITDRDKSHITDDVIINNHCECKIYRKISHCNFSVNSFQRYAKRILLSTVSTDDGDNNLFLVENVCHLLKKYIYSLRGIVVWKHF